MKPTIPTLREDIAVDRETQRRVTALARELHRDEDAKTGSWRVVVAALDALERERAAEVAAPAVERPVCSCAECLAASPAR